MRLLQFGNILHRLGRARNHVDEPRGTDKKTIKTGEKNMDMSIVSVENGGLTYKVLYTDRYAKKIPPIIDPYWLEETYDWI